jgi:pimeloyl-ACP methyl ester carboxylesterase
MLALLCAGLGAPVQAAGGVAPEARIAESRTCFVKDVAEPARCVAVEVPLDWARPDGATIRVEAAILRAVRGRPEPDPLIVLAGGPGQGASDYGALVTRAFGAVRRERDVVLFDQRGTGRSGRLSCDLPRELLAGFESPAAQAALRSCAASLGPRAAFYSSGEVVRDLEYLRAALALERINLWGGSFGTRTAQHYLRAYGARVRTVVLDGAIAAETPLFLTTALDAQAALDGLARRCEGDAACRAKHPALVAEVAALLAAAAGRPRRLVLPDPRTGQPGEVEVSRDFLAQSIRGALYVPALASALPRAIAAAAAGRYEPLLALNAQTSAWSFDTMALPVTLAVLCSEEMHRQSPEEAAAAALGFTGDSYYRGWRAACASWLHRPLPPQFAQRVPSRVPALVLSGARDPVTPPARGAVAAAQFHDRWHWVVAQAAHGVSALGCAPRLIAQFIARASAERLDARCLEAVRWPPFAFEPSPGNTGEGRP